jgi:hypothetical protein
MKKKIYELRCNYDNGYVSGDAGVRYYISRAGDVMADFSDESPDKFNTIEEAQAAIKDIKKRKFNYIRNTPNHECELINADNLYIYWYEVDNEI